MITRVLASQIMLQKVVPIDSELIITSLVSGMPVVVTVWAFSAVKEALKLFASLQTLDPFTEYGFMVNSELECKEL